METPSGSPGRHTSTAPSPPIRASARAPTRPTPVANPVPGRKKGTACARCRTQKIRCDDGQPACGNCARVGHTCLRPGLANNPDTLGHLSQVENRLRWLEDALRQVAPEKLDAAPSISAILPPPEDQPTLAEEVPSGLTIAPTRGVQPYPQYPQHQYQQSGSPGIDGSPDDETSPATATSTQIKPNEPLAHEVGLLSLANSKESKYLGPSSGVPFARLIFSAIPQSQGLATCLATPNQAQAGMSPGRAKPFPRDWVFEVDLQYFADAYFEMYDPLYPFLDENLAQAWLQKLFDTQTHTTGPHANQLPPLAEIEALFSPIVTVQLFLILALGSRTLEARLSTDFSSERYFATAMSRLDTLALHDSIEGLQIMLLLTLCSLNFVDGPNAWFLTSNIIASCLDLGFQRRWIEITASKSDQEKKQVKLRKTLRSGIFWSAYSLERQLAVVLGRPLTLRDEAIDVEFPNGVQSIPLPADATLSGTSLASVSPDTNGRSPKRLRVQAPSHSISYYSFRFDQILAEIKLTLHRVVNKPDRFPWPTDTPTFQQTIHEACDVLYNELAGNMKWQSRRGGSDHGRRSLEIKYHQCLMLLHRPSPAIPQPTLDSWRICYNSAIRTILVYAELQKFCKLNDSWLTAHTTFVCGITFLYCLWINPSLLEEVGIASFTSNAEACTNLLKHLGKTWSVADDALNKFERLVQTTMAAWRTRNDGRSAEKDVDYPSIPMQQPSQWQYDQCSVNGNNTSRGNPNIETDDFYQSSQYLGDYGSIEFGNFYTELGNMSAWFDLDWISQSQPFGEDQGAGL